MKCQICGEEHDPNATCPTSLRSITGEAGGPPTRVGTSVGDITAGLFTAIGIVSALHDRTRTGVGMRVDVAMLDCQVAILENALARYGATGEVPGPIGSRHPSITPFGAFRASDGQLIIAAGNDVLFRKLCAILGDAGLADDPRFATNQSRCDHQADLKSRLDTLVSCRTVAQWLDTLRAADLPCGPINDVAQVVADPHVQARMMTVPIDDPEIGNLVVAGNPIKLSAYADPPSRPPAPELDADRAALLPFFGAPGSDSEPGAPKNPG